MKNFLQDRFGSSEQATNGDAAKAMSERDSFQLARHTDPDTSHAAAEAIVPKLRKLQQIVLDHHKRAGNRGLTDFDLESLCGDHGSTYRTRRAELVEFGLIADSGMRRLQHGRNRIVWVITSLGAS